MPRALHPLIEAAGRAGDLPAWARLSADRRAHVQRVASLLEAWSEELSLPEKERLRWRAAGVLHDAVKDAPIADLRDLVEQEWPGPLLHAPAAAVLLEREGVEDQEFLQAITYHSVGHPGFQALGEHLYIADYLDPGRPEQADSRAGLRSRMPGGRDTVLRDVVRLRVERRLEEGEPILPSSVEFWNAVAGR